jgi:hypothetical protein
MAWQLQDISTRTASEVLSLSSEAELLARLKELAGQSPRIVSLGPVGEGYLQVGIGGPWAFVEYNQDDPGRAEAAVPDPSSFPDAQPESAAFECGGERSEIPGPYLIPAKRAVELIAEMLRTGTVSPSVRWEAQ